MGAYKTAQREELIAFLKENRSEAITVAQIVSAMKQDTKIKKVPAESTVYRLIKKLVEDGTVKRTVKGCSREFGYQIADSEHCREHLHMKCRECGRLMHMNDWNCQRMIEQMYEREGFYIDTSMVLTGVCRECKI
ncbi:MAG: transcriptional repressor [Ruminococcus sp.]|nr:transcriptional repressor [Ruminococcus sp.]